MSFEQEEKLLWLGAEMIQQAAFLLKVQHVCRFQYSPQSSPKRCFNDFIAESVFKVIIVKEYDIRDTVLSVLYIAVKMDDCKSYM